VAPELQRSAAMLTATYRSGTNRPAEIDGAVAANVPLGAVIDQLSRPCLERVIAYNAAGGKVFIDSGEFSNFRNGRTTDFERDVFPGYRELVARCQHPENLALVAPDRIGDQDATLELQRTYVTPLRAWIAAGVDVLVPLQKGTRAPAAVYAELVALLGPNFRLSIPCKEKSWDDDAIVAFLRVAQPTRVHLLGIGKSERGRKLIARIEKLFPHLSFTTDANFLRAVIGKRAKSINLAINARFAAIAREGRTLTDSIKRSVRVAAYAHYHRTGEVQ
jgi:hypothetical protein